MSKLLHGVSILVLASAAPPVLAQAAAGANAGAEGSDIIVTGTRKTGVKAADSAAPIQIVGAEALQHVGQPDLDQILSQNVPSFNVEQFGGDTAALTVQASLRGLNPNDTLVLVNGKRRHATANLSVDSASPYSGSATVDLSLIPVSAIDHVEVLQDGAAAQYGSDAIAGVVNIIMKTSNHGGVLSATSGEYYEGDGETAAWSANKGFALGDNGFVNVTVEQRYHNFSRQAGVDRSVSNPDGSLLSGISSVDAGAANRSDYPNVNTFIGDPRYSIFTAFYNAGYTLPDGIQLYSFGSYGHRIAQAYQNYRPPSKIEGTTSTGELVVPYPTGFDPQEKFVENDYSLTGGAKGTVAGWDWDLSSTYGTNHENIYTTGSANAQLFPIEQSLSATPIVPQSSFYDGAFKATEWASTLDLVHDIPVAIFAKPVTLALGTEFRRDTFGLTAGEPSSYYGAGAQSFDGYTPTDEGQHSRTNYAFYGDIAADPIKNLHLDLAGRFEHYSDFGDNQVGKLTARYDISPLLAFRGTVSTGFRAPTLQEEYYSGTNVSTISAIVQLPPNSQAAGAAGFGYLRPEKSTNYSAGFVMHPASRLQITADFYQIDLRDRILGTGFILGSYGSYVVSQSVLNAIGARGITLEPGLQYSGISIFTNAADTRTRGVEFTATYSSDFQSAGHVDWSLGFNYKQTDITRQFALPAQDVNPLLGQTSLLTAATRSALQTGTPAEKAILNAYWTLGKWSLNLRETVYGPTSVMASLNGTGSGAGAEKLEVGTTAITDLELGYRLTRRTRISIGANNLLDKRPPNVAPVATATGFSPGGGGNVYYSPNLISPYGINGGYYYGRFTYTF